MIRNFLLLALCCLASSGANAGEWGLGLGGHYIDDGEGVGITSAAVSFDYQINDNFAVAGQLAGGGSDDVGIVEIDLDTALSLSVRFGAKMGNTFLYASAGAYNANLSASGCYWGYCATETADGGGGMAGVGAKFSLGTNWALDLSYDHTFGDFEGNSGSVSIRYVF